MSSSPLINQSSDPPSPSLPVSVLPLATPKTPSPSSSPLLPANSSSDSSLQPPTIPSLSESPVEPQLTEVIGVDSLIQVPQQPIVVANDTDLQLTQRIKLDLQNIPMDVEDQTESQTSCESKFQTVSTTEPSVDSKPAVGLEVESQVKAEKVLEAEQSLPYLSQPEPEPANTPVKAPLAEPEKFICELKPINEQMEMSKFEAHPSMQPTQSLPSAQPQPSYHLKWIKWKGNKCPIVTQNENGPCPLIAIINVLLVKGRLRLPPMMEVITANQLIEYLGDCILENIPKGLKEEDQLNYEQNMHDAIAILPKLQTGLDVNVRFTGVSDFEYTPELIFFDLLHIPLYHGWLVDPNDSETATSIGNLSYNQLVDKIITHKTSTRPELAFEALVVEHFLQRTASQLTYHGLSKLNETLKEDELSVLFRNNHFITLLKSKDQLYQLVTDQGFLTESRVVWETLNNIENDGLFVDGDFIPVPPKRSLTAEDQQVQVDQDYLIALSLQEEQKKEFESEKEWETYKSENGLNELSDEEFARKLQEEEKRKAGQLTNYQGDRLNGQSSQFQNLPQSSQLNQSHNHEQSGDNFRSPHSGNKRSQSLPSRKNSNKPDDKSNTKCSMM